MYNITLTISCYHHYSMMVTLNSDILIKTFTNIVSNYLNIHPSTLWQFIAWPKQRDEPELTPTPRHLGVVTSPK